MTKRYEMKPVDPETARLAGDCAAQIATDLGESPEAWRGAAVMAHFIKATCMAMVDADLDETGQLLISEGTLTQLLTVGMLENLPTWPPGITGEPLINDGLPDEARPHFQQVPNE
jgi:hypothetical protein